MTLRFSGGNGGGRDRNDVRALSRPRTRCSASGGERVADMRTDAEACRKTAAGAPLDDAGEVRPGERQDGRKALQREMRVEHRVVRKCQARVAFPGQIAREPRLPFRAKRRDGGGREEILANAPRTARGFFVVPKVVE